MDVEDIRPGQRFEEAIDNTMARCDTALVVIGPRWAEIMRARAQEQQLDYVCHEVEAALARQITIVPVLVGGAGVAELNGLPGKLAALSQYEAAELRDTCFIDDCARLIRFLHLKPASEGKRLMLAGGAVLLLLVLVAIGIGPWNAYRARKTALNDMLATARTQMGRADYESAFQTYGNVLKTEPGDRRVMDLQVDAAMRWVEEFHIVALEGVKAEDLAGSRLAEIMPVLDAGLARAEGQHPRDADILAHIGWAHWLNRKIAQREVAPVAQRDLRQALSMDPKNVFAHAMLANWMMQTGGGTEEALSHFRIALEQNRERAWVRRMELGVLVYPRSDPARIALMQTVNDMRRDGEDIPDGQKRRILSSFNPTVNTAEELKTSLTAVSPADAWATYVWLDDQKTDDQPVRRAFIQASLQEIEGKRTEALAAFTQLRGELKRLGYDGRIATYVDAAIARLSKP
jgi:tetratricopeptide (TPR) repeat protein